MQHLFHILGRLLQEPGLTLPFLILVIGYIFRNGRKLLRRVTSGAARDWPTVSAKIEVVSAVEQLREGRYSDQTTGFLATLTYFYRNPELQMGEYTRMFPLQASAQFWAEQFKDRQVVVHINPKDPTDSALLDADLEGLTPAAAPSLEEAVRLEKLPRLKRGYLLLSGIAEIIALAGLSLSAAGLWMSVRTGTVPWPRWLFWTGAAMLAFNFASVWLVTLRAEDSHSYKAFLYGYTLWCPAWMRWGVNITSALVGAMWVALAIGPDLPSGAQAVMARMGPHTYYLWGCWGFLTTGAVHTAILRSQELTRSGIGEYVIPGIGE